MKPLIGNIGDELTATIFKRARKRVFNENEEVFSEGEPATFLPIVLSGKVKMIHFLEPGKDMIIGIFQNGEMFAVPPVFDGKTYPSTAVAMEITELALIERSEFLILLRESSEFSFSVIDWMSEMLREKTATIQNLATASPEHRVGNVLLKLAERDAPNGSVQISLRREDIAKIAGLTTETTIRVVRKLAEKGLVNIVRGKIVITDQELLRCHFG